MSMLTPDSRVTVGLDLSGSSAQGQSYVVKGVDGGQQHTFRVTKASRDAQLQLAEIHGAATVENAAGDVTVNLTDGCDGEIRSGRVVSGSTRNSTLGPH